MLNNKPKVVEVFEELQKPDYDPNAPVQSEQTTNIAEEEELADNFDPEFNNKKKNTVKSRVEKKRAEKNNQNGSKDLLRLEKDYVDGVYHESQHVSEAGFVISQLLQEKQKNKPKPQIGFMEESSLLGRVKGFLPSFQSDTQNLMQDEERKAKQNLDVIDEPQGEEKAIEMDLLLGLYDVKPKSQAKEGDIVIE